MFADPILTLFLTITLGYLFGQIKLLGISFGSSGVIFVALVMGYFGFSVPAGIGKFGLVLFVYCLGISAGPSFFRVFVSQGKSFAILGGTIVLLALGSAWCLAKLLTLPVDLACGILAGSMTSTPVLAACTEALGDSQQIAVGFGVAYPFGVIGVVLFVQLLPRVLGRSYELLEYEAGAEATFAPRIVRALIEVVNPAVVGRRLSNIELVANAKCQVSRIVRDNQLVPIPADFTLELGQVLLAVGTESATQTVTDLLGKRKENTNLILNADQQRMKVVVGAKELVGRSLRELKLLSRFGVTIARIMRHDVEFVPSPNETIQFGDRLTVVGEPDALEKFAEHAKHRERAFDETDVISLAFGLLAGILIGKIGFQVGQYTLSLGLAGGTLVTGLVLGHFGRIGPIVGHFPRAARILMTDIGLALFLAESGVNAGGMIAPVFQQRGLVLCLAAAAITLAPMVFGALLARFVLRMNLLQVLGAVCGGMTSTPGLGVITAQTDSNIPMATYAAVYPVSLILLTIGGRVLVILLS